MQTNSVLRKYRRLILIIFLGLFLFVFCIILYKNVYIEELRNIVKKRTFIKVIKYEEELSKIVEECKSKSMPVLIVKNLSKDGIGIFYKELNNKKINWVYNKFDLSVIIKQNNGKSISFGIYSPITLFLGKDYMYGFYYSENDKAINVVGMGEECEQEFEDRLGYWKYWYRTEKITDNWWFYERESITTNDN